MPTMKPRFALVCLMLLGSLVACSDRGGSAKPPLDDHGPPAHSALLDGGANQYAAETHQKAAKETTGLAELRGEVFGADGRVFEDVFEVRLEAVVSGESLRVVFADGLGRFEVRPALGCYRVQVRSDGAASDVHILDLGSAAAGAVRFDL